MLVAFKRVSQSLCASQAAYSSFSTRGRADEFRKQNKHLLPVVQEIARLNYKVISSPSMAQEYAREIERQFNDAEIAPHDVDLFHEWISDYDVVENPVNRLR